MVIVVIVTWLYTKQAPVSVAMRALRWHIQSVYYYEINWQLCADFLDSRINLRTKSK